MGVDSELNEKGKGCQTQRSSLSASWLRRPRDQLPLVVPLILLRLFFLLYLSQISYFPAIFPGKSRHLCSLVAECLPTMSQTFNPCKNRKIAGNPFSIHPCFLFPGITTSWYRRIFISFLPFPISPPLPHVCGPNVSSQILFQHHGPHHESRGLALWNCKSLIKWFFCKLEIKIHTLWPLS